MKASLCLVLVILSLGFASTVFAAEDDSVAPIFVYGRAGAWMASGFAVANGSYILTTNDAVMERTPTGRKLPVLHAVVVSRWTGEACPADIVARDEKAKIALLKLRSPAVPPVTLLGEDAFSRVLKATYGQVLSGEDLGAKYPTRMYAADVEKTPSITFVTDTWRGENAFTAEIDRNWLFLAQVTPAKKAPQGGLVVKLGAGALGIFQGRVVVEGGQRPVTFYRVLPSYDIKSFLLKSGVTSDELTNAASLPMQASDAETSFQTTCMALRLSQTTPGPFVDQANAVVKIRPKNAISHMLLATALGRAGKFEESLAEIDAALAIDPSLPDARLDRGNALLAAGKLADAEKAFRQAIADGPRDSRPLLALSSLLSVKDATVPEALKLAKDAVRIAPDDPAGHIAYARLMKKTKDYDGAAKELKALLEAAPKWEEVRIALGATYEAAGKPDLAETEYRKVVQDYPNSSAANINLIEFLISVGKKDEARQAIEAVRKLTLEPAAADAVTKLESRLQDTDKK